MSSIQKMIDDGVAVIVGFFVFGMLISALLYPMAASYQNVVFNNVTLTPNVSLGEEVGYYIHSPSGTGDIPTPYFMYVIISNMVLFASIALMLIVLSAIFVYMKFKK